MLEAIYEKQIKEVLSGKPDKLVLSNLKDKSYIYRKTVIQKFQKKGAILYQVERFTEKQAFHENVKENALPDIVLSLFPDCYVQLNVFGGGKQWDFKVTKKGKMLSNSRSYGGESHGKFGGKTNADASEISADGIKGGMNGISAGKTKADTSEISADGIKGGMNGISAGKTKADASETSGDSMKEDVNGISNGRIKKNMSETSERELDAENGGSCRSGRVIEPFGTPIAPHNRRKNYILQEGMAIPPLTDLGIFTKDGKVVHSMYDKYKQINRFLEMVEDVVKKLPADTLNRELQVIDFGCGKSYLTFILYYYMVEIRGMSVQMTGLDLKADVIERCNATAEKYHYDGLHFELGDINGYQTDKPVDLVVTLHACDTATDYALYNAICWNAGIILSVPCCQHELNGQIASDDLSILTRYGIVKERVSALMTDAIRANVLTYCGYQTQLLEFIDIAHSPKNILIRAVRKNHRMQRGERKAGVSPDSREMKAWNEAEQLCKEFHLKQTLMELVRGMN